MEQIFLSRLWRDGAKMGIKYGMSKTGEPKGYLNCTGMQRRGHAFAVLRQVNMPCLYIPPARMGK